MNSDIPFYDIIIVGAGLSGIGAAYHIQSKCSDKSYAVLEARASMGGTWDLFKYPGIRSDSDMYTLGFSFNPWKDPKAIADGPAILKYIHETAEKFGIDKKIKFNHKVMAADWSNTDKKWTLNIHKNDGIKHATIQCNFLFMCSGYYSYEGGYNPAFLKQDSFEGRILHPQKWDTNLNYDNKKVVVIGSGATAVTLVPEMSKRAEKVTMLQRSPSYILNLPSEDKVANFLKKILPAKWAHSLSRWKNIVVSLMLYKACRRWPNMMRKLLQKGVKKELGDQYEAKHFTPKYNPWDQRLCLIPDNDLFKAIKEEKADVITDTINQFTPKGILLDSGKELEADIIVTATGLKVQLCGGMTISIDGKLMDSSQAHTYKGVMFSDVPNFALAVGYTNASWTLKCELNCHFVTKVINYMDKHNYSTCTPRFDHTVFETEPLLDFDAGYIKRANNILPKQGSKAPWKVYQNYLKDIFSLKYSDAKDKYLEYQ